MQDEREALGRLERLQHDEERESHRIHAHRLGLGVGVGAGDHGIGYMRVQGVLPA
jgi:hypothetical protein